MREIRSTSIRPVVSLVIAALVVAGMIGAAEAGAKPKKGKNALVGVWSGDATFTSPPNFGDDPEAGGIEYETAIVITTKRAGRGVVRISGVIATVRTYCPDPGVADIRLLEGPKHGPKVSQNGSFSFHAKGVTITGHLGRSRGGGQIRASAPGGCELHGGKWQAKKQRF